MSIALVSYYILVLNPNNSNRQYENKLSRLPIGYTRLTNGHLMPINAQQPIRSQNLNISWRSAYDRDGGRTEESAKWNKETYDVFQGYRIF